jgi:hypothetical protein
MNISAEESVDYYELKKHSPWLTMDVLKLLNKGKQGNLQGRSKINWNNLINVRCEASILFRTKRREYLKDKINDLTMNSRSKHTFQD